MCTVRGIVNANIGTQLILVSWDFDLGQTLFIYFLNVLLKLQHQRDTWELCSFDLFPALWPTEGAIRPSYERI